MADPCLTPPPSGEIKEISVDVEAFVDNLITGTKRSRESERADVTTYTIHRVLRGGAADYSQYFVPEYFTIGPYHMHKPALNGWTEFNRWKRFPRIKNDRELLKKVVEELGSFMVAEARHCYDYLVSSLEDEVLIRIMIFDGLVITRMVFNDLFILESGFDPADLQPTRRDLLLLENQFPFSVLQCLFDSGYVREMPLLTIRGMTLTIPQLMNIDGLKATAHRYLIWPRAAASCVPIPDRVHHLLHLFHSSLLPPSPYSRKNSRCSWFLSVPSSLFGALMPWSRRRRRRVALQRRMMAIKKGLLFGTEQAGVKFKKNKDDGVVLQGRRALQNATQLLEAGVKFRKTKDDERSMIDVGFRRGYLEIPRLSLQSFTVSHLLNLLEFEKFHPECGNHVTVYLAFMNSLVDTAKDVELLVSSGVLENKLGSDEDVAHFFNTACDDKRVFIKFEDAGHYLTELFIDLEAYCATPRHRYRAKLERDYLSSPWSVISLIAGAVLLILTVVQTFMAVYSYFIPPKSRG